MVVPEELNAAFVRFNAFYTGHFRGRKLTLLSHVSKCDIVTTFTTQRYTLQASTLQTVALMQFNRQAKCSMDELVAGTGMTRETLGAVMQTLVRTGVIVQNADATVFEPAVKFKSKKLRVDINVPLKTDVKADNEQTLRAVEEDRKMIIQACLVRIMKTRKRMKHQDLISEAITQLNSRFSPKIPMLKV